MESGKKEFLGLLCNLYITVLLVALPLFTGEGYWHLDETKYALFYNISLLCLGGWLVAGMPWRIKALRLKRAGNVFSGVDRAVILYEVCVVLSALCSSYGMLAWKGYEGWYMGAVSQLLFAGIYFFVSRQYDGAAWPLYLGEAALFAATVLGLLHRLGMDPLGLMAGWGSGDWEYSHMLSTLGNINWLCGYYSVALAFAVEHFLREESPWLMAVSYAVSACALVLLCIQGSQGGLMVAVVCIIVCVVFGGKQRHIWKRMSLLLAGVFLGLLLMDVLMELRGESAAVVADGNLFAVVGRYVWGIGAAVSLFGFLAARRIGPGRRRLSLRLRRWIFLGAAAGMLLACVAVARGIDDRFGSGRGFLWRISLENFADASGKDRLLGAGPDCYGEAVFNRLGADTDVWDGEHWEGAVFVNAHCEPLNQLCNVGVLGTACYLAVFLVGLWRYRDSALGILVIAMYGMHSLVSFQQVLNTPLLFLVLGLCEAEKRQDFGGKGSGNRWIRTDLTHSGVEGGKAEREDGYEVEKI